jgi:hypothetical protein
MRSVADQLRAETHAAVARRAPAERIALALMLGDIDVRTFARARGVTEDEARRQLARQRQRGRVSSSCHERLLA